MDAGALCHLDVRIQCNLDATLAAVRTSRCADHHGLRPAKALIHQVEKMTSVQHSATERTYCAILDGILNGEHVPGAMLSEATLAAQIGVSRTPVRTALARLQDDGWITIYPKRGALVQGLSERAIDDLAESCLVLESVSVQLAEPERRHELATRLDEEIAVQRSAQFAGDLRGFIESTVAFHRSFVEISDNTVLLELDDRLADRRRFLMFSFGDTFLERCRDIIAGHIELVERLRADDAAGFAAVLKKHLVSTFGARLRDFCPDSLFGQRSAS